MEVHDKNEIQVATSPRELPSEDIAKETLTESSCDRDHISETGMHSIQLFRFRLLDLPLELQRLIFYHFFDGPYDITLEYERLTMLRSRFHVIGAPSVVLLLVNKHVNEHAAPMRHRLFSGRLILNSVFILVPLRRQPRFQWLREHTRILHFSDSSVHPERWSRYFDSFVALRRLEIDFPLIKNLEAEGRALTMADVLTGQENLLLIGHLDALQLSIVDQLRSGHWEVIVKQRFSLSLSEEDDAPGSCIVVDIKLTEKGAEVVRCRRQVSESLTTRKHAEPQVLGQLYEMYADIFSRVRANGNLLDQGSHRSMWEWYQAMSA